HKGCIPVEMIGRSEFPPIGELSYLLTLPAYGFYWFSLTSTAALPSWHEHIPEPMPEFLTLVMSDGWQSVASGRAGRELAADVLPTYLPKQRWFGAKDSRIERTRLATAAEFAAGGENYLLARVDVDLAGGGEPQHYFLPLAIDWDDTHAGSASPVLPYTMARVRRGPRLGNLYDAMQSDRFTRALLDAMGRGEDLASAFGKLRVIRTERFADVALSPDVEIRRMAVEQSNTSVLIGDQLVLKAYRRLVRGTHPELEIARFLTEVAGYRNTPPLVGAIEHVDQDGTPMALVVAQGFVRNQGDGWSFTTEWLERELEEIRLGTQQPTESASERLAMDSGEKETGGIYFSLADTLGRRTAELHKAFAIESGDPAFEPEPITEHDLRHWTDAARAQTEQAFAALRQAVAHMPGDRRDEAHLLLDRRRECLDLLDHLMEGRLDTLKTRHHGDYHLGQVLRAQADWFLIDFEGEPLRSLEERRRKHCPLRDVAGMLRSYDYAAWATVRRLGDHDEDAMSRILGPALEWQQKTAQAFLGGYRDAIAGCPSYPTDPETARRLLDFFLLEKACYEIAYEAANRPGWLDIPVKGVIGILDAHATANAEEAQ
ncbi:MAG TPA: putative maltokinase, partial [Arenibaculum sp.]|nr:putative maltokinase [Arenibaculum sp.]